MCKCSISSRLKKSKCTRPPGVVRSYVLDAEPFGPSSDDTGALIDDLAVDDCEALDRLAALAGRPGSSDPMPRCRFGHCLSARSMSRPTASVTAVPHALQSTCADLLLPFVYFSPNR
jgi:hypothetical protein